MAEDIPHHVLLVPELLEAILVELPIQDLLVNAQRVSHAWKDTIDSSAALQQALFFKSAPTPSYPQQISLNPLLQKAFPPWFRTTHTDCRGPVVYASLPWAESPDSREAFMRADACWRKMLPCQPAKKVLEVLGKNQVARIHYVETHGKVGFDGGVRMGHLYDFGFEVVRRTVGIFWIRWDETKGEAADEGALERRNKEDMLTMYTRFTVVFGRSIQVGEEFRSEAHEELVISMREERRSRQWYGTVGALPLGGWTLDKRP